MKINFVNQKYQDNRVAFNVLIKVGSLLETKANNGITHLVEHLVMNRLQQSNKLIRPYYINNIEASTYKARVEIEGTLLKKDAKHLSKIFNQIFADGLPSKQVFEKEKQTIIEELSEEENEPTYDDNRTEGIWAYNNSAYSLPIGGTVETVKKFNFQDAKDWYNKYFTLNNSQITIIGEVSLEGIGLESANDKTKIRNLYPKLEIPPIRSLGEQLILNKNKPDVAYRESWYCQAKNAEEVFQIEFLAGLLNEYLFNICVMKVFVIVLTLILTFYQILQK